MPLVPAVVLATLGGLEISDQTPMASLVRRVHGRKLLLVLDNCEHQVVACAELVEALLHAAPDLRVLATSREALRVAGEITWRVPSLEVPDPAKWADPDTMLACEAVKLFVDRIGQVETDFSLTPGNAAAVAQLCSRLDGIPLAIELAAARAAAMSVQDIAARLDDRFHLLTSGIRTALPRQRTLQATIDWSYDLLSEPERVLFRRLAVFAGGWTLEAAEMVCSGEPLARSDILHVLMRLVDQSLVNVHIGDGRTRYGFLETVRVYAAERMRAAGEASPMQARHREWCLLFAERAAAGLTGSEQFAWFQLLTTEQNNVRAALNACGNEPSTAESELRLAAAMGRFWWPRNPGEGRRRLAAALSRAPATPSSARCAALSWQGSFEVYFGDPAIGRALTREALVDARAIGDAQRAATALGALMIATEETDTAGRVALLEEGVALARAAGVKGELAMLLGHLAAEAAEADNLQRARELLDESEGLARTGGGARGWITPTAQLGWLAIEEGRLDDAELHFRALLDRGAGWGGYHLAPGLFGLGQVMLRRGDLEYARALYRELLLDLCEFEPDGVHLADALVYLASVDAVAGLHQRAQRLLGANESWHAARGGAGRIWQPSVRGPVKRGLVPIPPLPTEAALVQARAEGRAMSLDEAVAYALDPIDASTPEPGVARTDAVGVHVAVVDTRE
jgi:non-specific serine/threonine protein kinase